MSCINTHTHTHTHAHARAHPHKYTRIYRQSRINAHVYTLWDCVCCAWRLLRFNHICPVYTHTHTHTHTRARAHTRTHARACTHTHTHIYRQSRMYTHICNLWNCVCCARCLLRLSSNVIVRYLNVRVRYLNVRVRYLNVRVRYLNVRVRYLNLRVRYSNVRVRYLHDRVPYTGLLWAYCYVVTRHFRKRGLLSAALFRKETCTLRHLIHFRHPVR